jgi:hypothetical protein
MMKFEAFTKGQSGFLVYEISPGSRAELLRHFPAKYPDTICHHITVKPGRSTDELPDKPHSAHVIGYEDSGDGLEALVVEIDGTTRRTDGSIYHITHSLDRQKGQTPKNSNDLLRHGFKHVSPIPLDIEPAFLRSSSN